MALWYRLYIKDNCPVSIRTRELLQVMGADYYEFNITKDTQEAHYLRSYGITTFPQVFIEETLIGGYDELKIHFGIKRED